MLLQKLIQIGKKFQKFQKLHSSSIFIKIQLIQA